MDNSIREKLLAGASSLITGSSLITKNYNTNESRARQSGWSRRVLANLEAHVRDGIPLTEETTGALADHREATKKIKVGSYVTVNNRGEVVPAGIAGSAAWRVTHLGEAGQVTVAPLSQEYWYHQDSALPDPVVPETTFHTEHMNVPFTPEPAGLDREVPAVRPPLSPTVERLQEAQRQEAAIREAAASDRVNAAQAWVSYALNANLLPVPDSTSTPGPDPLQLAEPVEIGRPKRRILRKENDNG